jgi:hypothetical protein
MSDLRAIEDVEAEAEKPKTVLVDPNTSAMNDSLTWEDIENADDLSLVAHDVPEWGKMPDGSPKKAYLIMLSARETITMTKKLQDPAKKADGMIEIVAKCLVNPNTRLPLVPAHKMKTFAERSVKVFTRLQKECMRINGMLDEKTEAELAKND